MKLIEYFLSNENRKVIHKPMNYFEIYEKHFAAHKNKAVHLLEIGVDSGGSLKMFQQYFGKHSSLAGIDINSNCVDLETEGFKIYIGDQADKSFLESVMKIESFFDIIIDDGGNFMNQQITSFEVLFKYLSEGGLYLIEDVGTSFKAGYGGGIRREGTFVEMAKDRIDDLYIYENEKIVRTYFAKNIYAIYFYDNIIIFEKRKHDHAETKAIGR
jgi:hypothetical protein